MATNSSTSFGRSPNQSYQGGNFAQQSWAGNSYQQQATIPQLQGTGSRVVSDRLANNPYGRQPADEDSLFAPDPPLFDRPEIQYIEVERPVVTEKIVPKEIYEEVYVNVPTVKEVIVPVYVPVPQEEYVEVVELLPPPLEDIPQEYRKIIAEGAVKLGLFLMENHRLKEKLERLKAIKEHEIIELRKRGIVYDKNKNRRYKHLKAKRAQEGQQVVQRSPSIHTVRPAQTSQKSYSVPQQSHANWIERKITEFELVQEPVPIPDIPPTSQVLFQPSYVTIVPNLTDDIVYRAARSDSPPREPKDPNRPQLEQRVTSLTPWVKRIQRKEPYVEYPPEKIANATKQPPVVPAAANSPKATPAAVVAVSTRNLQPSLPVAAVPIAKAVASPTVPLRTSTPTRTGVSSTTHLPVVHNLVQTGRSAQPMQVHGQFVTNSAELGPVKIQSNNTKQLPPGAKVVSDYYTASNTELRPNPTYGSSIQLSPSATQIIQGNSGNKPYGHGMTIPTTGAGVRYQSTHGSLQGLGTYNSSNIGNYTAAQTTSQRLDTTMKVYNLDTNPDYKPVKIESGRSVSPVGSPVRFENLSSPIKYAAEHDTTVFRYNPLPVSSLASPSQLASSAVPKSSGVSRIQHSGLAAITERTLEQQSYISNAPTQVRKNLGTSNLQVHTSKMSSGSNGLRQSGYEQQETDLFGRATNFMDGSEDGVSIPEQQALDQPFAASMMRNQPSFGGASRLPGERSSKDENLMRSELSDDQANERSTSRSSVGRTTKKSSLMKNKPSLAQSQFDV